MRKQLLLLTILFIVMASSAQIQKSQKEKADIQLNERGEVYFSFNLKSKEDVLWLTKIISIDNIQGNTVIAYANAREFNEFLNYTSEFVTLAPPSSLVHAEMSDDPRQVLEWNYYPTYTAYESIMAQFATDHPDLCRLITISTLASGRKIQILKITDNPDIAENEPEFLYTSSIHGDETTGYVLMLHLIDYLLANYNVDPRITSIINNTEIYINPLANPDGTYKGGNASVNGATRGNANNVDLNRNYADPEDGPHPDGNPWQPETVAFMNFAGFHHFTMSANFHGGEEVINYPWDTWSRLAADDNWWVYVSREYADTVHLHAPANYMNEFENGITNGYAWYTISGGRQDYMNYFRNCREVTMEISDTKLLPANQLINHWNYNYRSLLNYLEQSNFGLHGIVTDSITGVPLNARVDIIGHDLDSSHVFTDPAAGDYHRLLKGGTYNVTFSAAGHISKTITVQITDRQKTDLNVQLFDGKLHTNFSSNHNVIPVGATVQFTDQSAGNPVSWRWEFEGGTPAVSTDQHPQVSYNEIGDFNVKLFVSRPGSNDSLAREEFITVKEGVVMTNQTVTICDALFMDNGGIASNYSDNENFTMTFIPLGQGNRIKASFIEFEIEPSQDCTSDVLKVYDGNSAAANLIGSYCGSALPEAILATNSQGALTFVFESNSSVNLSGWNILLECDSNVGVIESNAVTSIKIFPNPSIDGVFSVEAEDIIKSVVLCDLSGRVIQQVLPEARKTLMQANASPGIYILKIIIGNHMYNQKIAIGY